MNKWFRLALAVGFGIVVAVLSVSLINPTNSDIPRHLLSGRLMTQALQAGNIPSSIWYTNAYTFTHQTFPFVNHHWLSAVFFYLLYQVGGWVAIHVLYLGLLAAAACCLALFVESRSRSLGAVVLSLIVALPLLASRLEVRPEGWSYLFIALYLYLLSKKNWSRVMMVMLMFVQLLWANLHIYFVMGVGFVWLYTLTLMRKKPYVGVRGKSALVFAVAMTLVSLVNPHGVKGFLYPFTIFQNYGYDIVENKSVFFLWNWGMHNPLFIHAGVVTALTLLALWYQKRTDWRLGLLAVFSCVWGLWGIRNFPIVAIIAIPYIAPLLEAALRKVATLLRTSSLWSGVLLLLVAAIATLFVYGPSYSERLSVAGLGALDTTKSDTFIRTHLRGGRFYNNYDIGSYLEWLVYPQLIYVDNRPEAFPAAFFTDEYKRMDDPKVFAQAVRTYQLDTIVFQYRDLTPWSQTFMKHRLADSAWVPVFVDEQVIVFVRDTERYRQLIDRYRLPPSLFQFGTQ